MMENSDKGIRAAQAGVLINAVLTLCKFLAGIVGNSYALVADAVESATDIFSSLIVMGGLQIARRNPDQDFPQGYGRAETLATVVVALMLIGAATGIAIEAVREILTPHHLPAPWTLIVLLVVVISKWIVAKRVMVVGKEIGSTAVTADAWHHLSDAVTSCAAFIGISIALWGGPGWEPADDWAALVAVLVIAFNGLMILWHSIRDLMDASPSGEIVNSIRTVAEKVPGVQAVEKLFVRRVGADFHVLIHIQSDPSITLSHAHAIGGQVKSEIRSQIPRVNAVHVHMEPFLPPALDG